MHRDLARRFEQLQTAGLLRPAPPERLVAHYLALISSGVSEVTADLSEPTDGAQVRDAVVDAVRAFLTGYTTDR